MTKYIGISKDQYSSMNDLEMTHLEIHIGNRMDRKDRVTNSNCVHDDSRKDIYAT